MHLRAPLREQVQAFAEELSDGGAASDMVKKHMGIVRRAFTVALENTLPGSDGPLFPGPNIDRESAAFDHSQQPWALSACP